MGLAIIADENFTSFFIPYIKYNYALELWTHYLIINQASDI